MTKICIEDLTECKALDKEALSRIQGGHSFCGTGPESIEEILAKYMESLPEVPMPYEPYEPGVPIPI